MADLFGERLRPAKVTALAVKVPTALVAGETTKARGRSYDSARAPDALFDLRFSRDARLSLCERKTAWCASSTDAEWERFNIASRWLGDGPEVRLPFDGNASAPRWSPDGACLAFVDDGGLHIANGATFDVDPVLTSRGRTVHGVPAWSLDGSSLSVSPRATRARSGPGGGLSCR